jgi:hypothetical protein
MNVKKRVKRKKTPLTVAGKKKKKLFQKAGAISLFCY